MGNWLLYGMTALLPVVGFFTWLYYRGRRKTHLPLSSWLEGMRALDAEMPLPKPRPRSKFTATGAVGICKPEPKKAKNVSEIRRRSGR